MSFDCYYVIYCTFFLDFIIILFLQTFLNFPHMASAKANRDYVVSTMIEALVVIAELTEGKDVSSTAFLRAVEDRPGLYQHFDELEVGVILK